MDATGLLVLFLGIPLVIVLIMRANNNQKKEEARLKYQEALEHLKSDPTSPSLKQTALELGRYYSNLTRQRSGVTLFDEVALMNDLNAVTAGAVAQPPSSEDRATKQSVEERLAKLSELKSKGLIDEQEYAEKRKKILDEM
jgi:hypothetical protein